MEIKSYLLGKKAGGGGGEINNQNKTITQDGTYTADTGYTGIGTATVQTNAAEYKGTATNWGNGYPSIAYYLAGNWGDPTPHAYTYEELQTIAPQANQTISEGITDIQTAKYKLYQIIGTIAQRGVTPNPVPQLQGDKIQKFVDAIISQVNPSTALENKSVTITENGTTTITPSSDKYGMSSVSVTTNVSGGGTDEYFGNQISRQTGSSSTIVHQLIKKIPSFTIPYNVKSLADAFSNFYNLESVPLFDTGNITSMNNMFYNCSSLTAVPLFNTSNVTNMGNMFWGCSNLESVPLFDTGNVTSMANMFNTCSSLKNIPLFNTSKVTSFVNMFKYTRVLTDTSLDNILQMCINATSYTGTKTLSIMGVEDTASASRIQALPHYQDFLDAGWTIGY